jgi:hypothetical protein
MNLTQNFTLSEMTKSETALRYGMANDPTDTEIENMRLLCEKVLQPVRNYYGMGVKVNSVGSDIRWLTPRWVAVQHRTTAGVWRQTLKFLALPTLIWHNGSKTIVSLNSLY